MLRRIQTTDARLIAEDAATGAVLVHGDYGPNTVLLDPAAEQVTAIVDWEWAHVGDPVEDLAWCEWIVPDAPSGSGWRDRRAIRRVRVPPNLGSTSSGDAEEVPVSPQSQQKPGDYEGWRRWSPAAEFSSVTRGWSD